MTPAPTILFLVGETSGDQHAVAVARSLKERLPGVRLLALGGPRLESEGAQVLEPMDRLAVVGFVEVIRHLGFFRGLLGRVRDLLASGSVDLVVAVDFPGFNLRAVEVAHREGVPVLYYIAPKFWAWKPGRVQRLAAHTRHVASILPFEIPLLEEAGVRATFVGHPLMEVERAYPDRDAFCRELGLDPARPILAVLPGSREVEVGHHLDTFAAAARQVVAVRPEAQPVFCRAPSLPEGRLAAAGFPVTGDAGALFHHARVGLVKSGTGTLEAALAGLPMVVAYRTHPLTFALARRLLRSRWISLPNLVANRAVVPELLQGGASPEELTRALLAIWDDGPARQDQIDGLSGIHRALGTAGAGDRVAALAVEIMEGRR